MVFGGVSINPQMMATRRGLDVLVACPGRLMDLYNQNAVKFDEVEILVLDEADRMLDMGFIRDIRRILALLPKKRQNLLFSATFADEIRELATGLLDNPAVIEVAPRNSTAERIEQLVHPRQGQQDRAPEPPHLQQRLAAGAGVHPHQAHRQPGLPRSSKRRHQRRRHPRQQEPGRPYPRPVRLQDGSVRVMVATDIAARGLDIDKLPQVVNFELPNVAED